MEKPTNKEQAQLLEEYLFKRDLFRPLEIAKKIIEGKPDILVGEEILNNDELLAKVAGAWTVNKEEITAVIKARVLPNLMELVIKAYPQETIVLRQSILEICEILNDFEKYTDEYRRRIAETERLKKEDNEQKGDYKLT